MSPTEVRRRWLADAKGFRASIKEMADHPDARDAHRFAQISEWLADADFLERIYQRGIEAQAVRELN